MLTLRLVNGKLAEVPEEFIKLLREVVGPDHVQTGAATLPYCTEPTGGFSYPPTHVVVVTPANTEEVSRVLALLNTYHIPCVIRGGGTGLVGANVPRDGVLVVLSTLRLKGIWDHVGNEVTFGAAVTLPEIHAFAASVGMVYGVNFSAAASIGGTVANNAGGENVIMYGMTEDQVVDITYATADGEIRHMRGLKKHNDGYQLDKLALGSEGTLMVITEVRVMLRPKLHNRVVISMPLPSIESVMAVVAELIKMGLPLLAAEYLDRASFDFVCEYMRKSNPFAGSSVAGLLLIELAGNDQELAAKPTDTLEETAIQAISQLIEQGIVDDRTADLIRIESDAGGRERLWSSRRELPSSLNAKQPLKLDVSLPAHNYAEFVRRVGEIVKAICQAAGCYLFGHVADGTVHVNILGVPVELKDAVTKAVLELAAGHGGSISSEHGLGCQKPGYAYLVHSPEHRRLMEAIKAAFDPGRILNPGAVVPW